MNSKSPSQRCGNCFYFRGQQGQEFGYCFAHPPGVMIVGMAEPSMILPKRSAPQPVFQGVRPRVYRIQDWCGEWRELTTEEVIKEVIDA